MLLYKHFSNTQRNLENAQHTEYSNPTLIIKSNPISGYAKTLLLTILRQNTPNSFIHERKRKTININTRHTQCGTKPFITHSLLEDSSLPFFALLSADPKLDCDPKPQMVRTSCTQERLLFHSRRLSSTPPVFAPFFGSTLDISAIVGWNRTRGFFLFLRNHPRWVEDAFGYCDCAARDDEDCGPQSAKVDFEWMFFFFFLRRCSE